jgi:hypothetical protein
MFSNCFWKYFIAETIVSISCAIVFTAIEKPMPLWLTTVIGVTFTVLYIIERISVFIKELKND